MADGSVNEQRNTLSVNIHMKDMYIIELLKDISPEAYIREQKSYESKALVRGHSVKNSGSIRISIASKLLIEDLKNYGIVQNKTYNELHLPNIEPSLIRHFIRGYFDGDGSFSGSVREPNIKNREKNPRVIQRWEICSKTSSLLLEMQKWFSEKDISININYIKRDDMYRLTSSSKKEIKKIFDLLFSDIQYTLPRKYEIINYYVNTEVSQLIADHRNAQEVNVNESNNPPKSAEHLEISENVR